MNRVSKVINILLNDRKVLILIIIDKISFLFSDRTYLKLQFKLRMGYPLDLDNPKSFSEKLQWLKLYDRNPLYPLLVDKYTVKDYVACRIGSQHIIPTIGVWGSINAIHWEDLPSQFVLKTTQGGGSFGIVICMDKAHFDKRSAKKKLRKALAQDIYKTFREWPYKNVKAQIIAEQYMEQKDGANLIDYKFFCFNGEPRFLYVRWEDPSDKKEHINFITLDWQSAPFFRPDCPPSTTLPHKPSHFDEMCSLSKKLSSNIPFVRVDLYEINDKVFFSELTFYPSSGLLPFEPDGWDDIIGNYLELPENR